jgi:malignant T-cell-amplified sequence
MDDGIPAGSIVAVMAEGKEHAFALGLMKMSSDEIKKVNKGIGVDTLTHLGDPLWHLKL